MIDDDSDRTRSVLDQLRNHEFPSEWARELGDVDGDTFLLLTWLEVLSRHVHAAHTKEVRSEGMPHSEARLLYYLLLEGPPYHQSPTRLNEQLDITSGGITKTVDRLESRGLVERQPDAADGRSIKVGLTEAGIGAAKRMAQAVAKRYDQLVGPLGPEERKQAVKTLRTLVDAFDEPL